MLSIRALIKRWELAWEDRCAEQYVVRRSGIHPSRQTWTLGHGWMLLVGVEGMNGLLRVMLLREIGIMQSSHKGTTTQLVIRLTEPHDSILCIP